MCNFRQKIIVVLLCPLAMIATSLLLLTVLGLLTPRNHVVTKKVKLNKTPEEVWETICDFQNQALWRSNIERVERMPDRDGKEVWKEIYKNGDELPFEITESNAPYRLVRTSANPNLPFSGIWEIEVTKETEGSSLTITERGEIPNPFMRGMFSLLIGYEETIVQYERELVKKFGENGVIE